MRSKFSLRNVLTTGLVALILLVPLLSAGAAPALAADGAAGAVYVTTNSPAGNAVIMFSREADGSLTSSGSFATGGLGSGIALSSQGALALSEDGRFLFTVNAGSNQVSVFMVIPGGLSLAGTFSSGGILPTSLTLYKNMLYVLNAGGSGNIAGFFVSAQGQLQPIPGSMKYLSNGGSGATPGPAQVSFTPDGSMLVVTEKGTNSIDTFIVNSDGSASGPTVNPSSGIVPYGFGFGQQNVLIVSEAFPGVLNGSAVSSYTFAGTALDVISASAPTYQTAACWVVVTGNGRFAYAANAASGSISGYAVMPDGSLSLLNADGRTGVLGSDATPIDMSLSHNSQYLYDLGNGTHMIYIFAVNAEGSLTALGAAPIPAGTAGIAAW
jgi:6-phosphogluconolactonase (cycloisomerase 2 family)